MKFLKPAAVIALLALIGAQLSGLSTVRGKSTTELPWERHLLSALERAAREEKLVVLDIYADWCGPCRLMDQSTFTDPSVVKRLTDFVVVKVNADTDVESASRYSTGSLPTSVVLNAEGVPLASQGGYLAPEDYLAFLKAAEDRLAGIQKLGRHHE